MGDTLKEIGDDRFIEKEGQTCVESLSNSLQRINGSANDSFRFVVSLTGSNPLNGELAMKLFQSLGVLIFLDVPNK